MIPRHGPILDPFCRCTADIHKNRVKQSDFIYPSPIVAAPFLAIKRYVEHSGEWNDGFTECLIDIGCV